VHSLQFLLLRCVSCVVLRTLPLSLFHLNPSPLPPFSSVNQLNTSLASSESGRWTPGVSFRGATVDPALNANAAKADRKAAHRAVSHAVTQGVANGSSSSSSTSQIATSPITSNNNNNGEGGGESQPVEASVELSAAEQLALKLSGQEALTQQELPTSGTGLLRVQSLHDSSTSPAFRRALVRNSIRR